MSLKAELETWGAALQAYDDQDFDKALATFETIADSSKIHTNIGLIYATLGEHELAVDCFNAATELDKYLAVAYFQCGVSNFLLGRFSMALKDFEEAFLYLRGNQNINYEQLGLKFKLYSAEVLFNKGLCKIYLGYVDEGIADLRDAQTEKATEEHSVIDDAIRDQGEEYTVFSIPVGVLYRPSENKLKNAKTKDYLGKAKLISASDANDAFTTFTGVTRINQGQTPSGAPLNELQRSGTSVRAPEFGGRSLGRTATSVARVEQSSVSDDTGPPVASGLRKSATTIAVPPRRASDEGPRAVPSRPTPPLRSATAIVGSQQRAPPVVSVMGGPIRGLSLKRPPTSPAKNNTLPVRSPNSPPQMTQQQRGPDGGGNTRLTEIYDDYLGADGSEGQPPLPPMPTNSGAERVAAWATKTAPGPPAPLSRVTSTRSPASVVAGSIGSLRRKVTKRMGGGASSSGRSRGGTLYDDDEEEGYASGDYEDGTYELTKIRIKIHYNDDVRGMTLSPEVSYEEFLYKVSSKFGKSPGAVSVKFKDEDGMKVSIMDDSDYDLALETARESAKGKPEGRLEIWCIDER